MYRQDACQAKRRALDPRACERAGGRRRGQEAPSCRGSEAAATGSSAAAAAGESGSASGRLRHLVPPDRAFRLQRVAREGAAGRAALPLLRCLAGRQRRQQPRHSLTCTLTWRPSDTAEARAPPEEGCGHMHVILRCRGQHLPLHLRKAAWRSQLPLVNRACRSHPTPQNYGDHARGTATWRRPRQTPPAVVGDSARSSGTRFVATSRIWQVHVSQSTLRNTIRIGRTLVPVGVDQPERERRVRLHLDRLEV